MKVFISWSGIRSHRVAQLLESWLPTVTDKVQLWLSSSDITSGAQWFSEITHSLSETTQGIFCLTHENVSAPWVLFEAGAIAKGLAKSKVYTFLIDLEIQHVKDPLAQFNHTLPAAPAPRNMESMLKLVKSINASQGEQGLRDDIITALFEKHWPQFESEFSKIISETEAGTKAPPQSDSYELSKDILEIVRGLDKQVSEIRNGSLASGGINAMNTSFESARLHFAPLISKITHQKLDQYKVIYSQMPLGELIDIIVNDILIEDLSASQPRFKYEHMSALVSMRQPLRAAVKAEVMLVDQSLTGSESQHIG